MWVVILVYIKLISVLLTKRHSHVLVVVRVISWHTTGCYDDFATISSL